MRLLALLLLLPSAALAQGVIRQEPTRTNYALQSHSLSSGTAMVSPWNVGAATVSTVAGAPIPGGGTWAQIDNTGNSNGGGFATFTTPTITTYTASIWMRKPSGTGYAGLLALCGGGAVPTSCVCKRSDSPTCAASVILTNYCQAQLSDLGTAPVRVCVMVTCSIAQPIQGMNLDPGQRGVAVGTTMYGGAQLEPGVGCTSNIVTTTQPRTRRAGSTGRQL